MKPKVHDLKFSLDNNKSSILALVETWLDFDILPILGSENTKHFTFYQLNRDYGKGGGVLLCVPSKYHSILVSQKSILEFEAITIDLLLRPYSNFRLVIVYRPPRAYRANLGTANQFFDYIDSVLTNKIPTVILGDFNLPMVDWGLNCVNDGPSSISSLFFSGFMSRSLTQLINKPTRGDNVLDLVFESEPGLVSDWEISIPFCSSDHDAILIKIPSLVAPNCHINRRSYNFSKAKYDSIEQLLVNLDFSQIFMGCATADQMYAILLDILWELIELFVPLLRQNNQSTSHWSPKTRRLHRKQLSLYKKFKLTRSLADKTKLRSAYYLARRAKRSDIFRHENTILNSNNDKIFWSFVNSKLSVKHTRLPPLRQ
ncbi:MAG: hypothetical protein GY821_00145, partial [Gammaproteobacteria bacterium]|nr:hypothetical protein [Gammaproteobacteria bacterium]